MGPSGARRIGQQELADAVAGNGVRLVEALGPPFFADVRLPGAINIPPGRVDDLASRLLPDRSAMVVVYCSRTCSNADAVASRLVEMGYLDVRVFAEGKETWIEAGLPVHRGPVDP
jgi:rhodanese-related sulfurtransferase